MSRSAPQQVALENVRTAAVALAGARETERIALAAFFAVVRTAVDSGVPVREVGAAGGISGARASQIARVERSTP